MPKYLGLLKYSTGALAAVRAEGYASRVQRARTAAESVGGSLEEMHFTLGGRWDAVLHMTVPSSAALFNLTQTTLASGAFERMETHEIFTGEEADKAQSDAVTWSAPSSSD